MIPQSPREWLDQIKLGIRYRDAFDRKSRWQRNYDWFMGKYDAGLIAVNTVFGIARGLIPQLYFKAPTVIVRPRPSDPSQYADRMRKAKLLEAIDTQLIQQMGLKRTLKQVILDAFLYNVGLIKVGYHSLETELSTDPQEDETLEMLGELTGEPVAQEEAPVRKREWHSYHDLVKPDSPWALRWSPKDFVLAPGARSIEESPWCAFRFVRRLDEIEASSVYPRSLKRGLRPNSSLKIDGEGGVKTPNDKGNPVLGTDDKYVEAWEVWDKRLGEIIVVAEGHPKYLRKEEHGLQLDGLPVTALRFNEVGDDFWGISHIDAVAPQIAEYCETRTHEMFHRKMSSLKLLLDRNLLKPEEIDKMRNGDVLPVILTEGPPQAGHALLQPNMSRDIYKVADDIFADIRTIIGYSRNQGAEMERSRRTATEIGVVAQHSQIRDDELRDIVAESIADLFENKVHPLVFQNWTSPRVFQVTGMEGWQQVVPNTLKGPYDVYVVPDSTLPLSKEMAKNEALAVFKALRGDPMIRQNVLYKQTFDKFEGVRMEELMKTPEEMEKDQQAQMQAAMAMEAAKHPVAGNVKPIRKEGA